MLEFLLAHIVIPFFAGGVVLAIVLVGGKDRPTWDAANDAALDLTILSIGATGALFLNPKLMENWKELAVLFGILVVLADLMLSCILAYRKRWKEDTEKELSFANIWPDLFVGSIALVLTTAVFVFGYLNLPAGVVSKPPISGAPK